jgi:hypothetical protein
MWQAPNGSPTHASLSPSRARKKCGASRCSSPCRTQTSRRFPAGRIFLGRVLLGRRPPHSGKRPARGECPAHACLAGSGSVGREGTPQVETWTPRAGRAGFPSWACRLVWVCGFVYELAWTCESICRSRTVVMKAGRPGRGQSRRTTEQRGAQAHAEARAVRACATEARALARAGARPSIPISPPSGEASRRR